MPDKALNRFLFNPVIVPPKDYTLLKDILEYNYFLSLYRSRLDTYEPEESPSDLEALLPDL